MNIDFTLQDQIQIQAIEVQCAQPTEAELALYVYEAKELPDQCCPSYTRTACLMEDNQIPVSHPPTRKYSYDEYLDLCHLHP